jgi:hypothetical protein
MKGQSVDRSVRHALVRAREEALDSADGMALYGFGCAFSSRADGSLACDPAGFVNKITDNGDTYYVTRMIAGVLSAAPADATKVTGMKLGTSTTAAAKNGAGAALVTYISGSNRASFDTSFPKLVDQGAGNGKWAQYQTTSTGAAGTSSNINEAVIVNDASTDATSVAGNTISRGVFSSTQTRPTSGDTLIVVWNHLVKGA